MLLNELVNQPKDAWVEFSGQVTEIKESKMRIKSSLSKNPGQQYQATKVKLADQTATATAWLLFIPQIGMTYSLRGMVKEFQRTKYLDYCNFTQQQATQNAPQRSQNAPQATNSCQVSPDSLFIGKQAVWKGYCETVKNSEGVFDVNIAIDQCWQVWNKFIIPEAQPLEPADNPNDFQQFANEHPVEQDDIPWENS
jgi:hypothetical protein